MSGPRTAAEAVRQAAARCRVGDISLYAAEAIARAAIAFADGVQQIRQAADRLQWEQEGFRDYLRQDMRYKLLYSITRQGLVPVALPQETVRYMTGGILDPENQHEVPGDLDAPWQAVVLTLEVGVRRPPVDREAAVRAGVLKG